MKIVTEGHHLVFCNKPGEPVEEGTVLHAELLSTGLGAPVNFVKEKGPTTGIVQAVFRAEY